MTFLADTHLALVRGVMQPSPSSVLGGACAGGAGSLCCTGAMEKMGTTGASCMSTRTEGTLGHSVSMLIGCRGHRDLVDAMRADGALRGRGIAALLVSMARMHADVGLLGGRALSTDAWRE